MIALLFTLAIAMVLLGVVLAGAAAQNKVLFSFDKPAVEGWKMTASATIGVVVFFVALGLTQRFILSGGIGLTAIVVPKIFISQRIRERAIRRQLAAAEFVESVQRSLIAGGNLGGAITNAATHAPPELQPELAEYLRSQRSGGALSRDQALRSLATQCNEPAMDLVVAQLLAADGDGAGDLSSALADIADSTRTFAEGRAKTQTARARIEMQSKILGVLVIFGGIFAGLVSKDMAAVYDSSLSGQLAMIPSVALFVFGWWWMDQLNKVASQGRFKLRDADES